CLLGVAVLLILMTFFVVNNSFYKWTNSSKAFGFSVPSGLSRAVDFVKDNKIEGPMFNNFDIGGYLIWKLYPQEKVFVDNRPEAYSVKFFKEIYKPMQEDKEKWLEFSDKYSINFVFFAHTDTTPWGDSFLRNIVKNPNWKIVYINEDAIILVKNNNKNTKVVSRFSITEKNVADRITEADSSIVLSRLFYSMSWREASIYFAEEAIRQDPKNSRAYLYKGLVHAYYTDEQNQKLAEENIKKAIDLGLKDAQYYSILGVVYMNLGRLESAQLSFKEAIRLDEDNVQAKEFLNKYFNK
ncbi:MAG: tetratricopeptide repeat protein, partial [bacterium]|nr:tetratricopeptide repeat protein [bacterium]